MAQTVMDVPCRHELAAIETETRFFMRLLLGAGIAAATLVSCGVVWHADHLGRGSATIHEIQTQPIGPE
jgi:hypothetical protein